MKLTHPGAKKPIEVRADQVEMYESQGWSELKQPEPKSEDKPSK